MTRIFYRIRNDTHWVRHNFKELDKAKLELKALHNGTHIVSELVPRDDYYIVKVKEIETKI